MDGRHGKPDEHATRRTVIGAVGAALLLTWPAVALAGPGKGLTGQAATALNMLYATNPPSSELGRRAAGILVFPDVVKIGVLVAGHKAGGVLLVDGKAVSSHSMTALGAQREIVGERLGFVLFLMTETAVTYLRTHPGWSLGSGPRTVFLNNGVTPDMNPDVMREDIYALAVNHQGLVRGAEAGAILGRFKID